MMIHIMLTHHIYKYLTTAYKYETTAYKYETTAHNNENNDPQYTIMNDLTRVMIFFLQYGYFYHPIKHQRKHFII
jgi:hypothetical protein